jgi:hypothetical protein
MGISLSAKGWAAVAAVAILGIANIASRDISNLQTAIVSGITIAALAYIVIYVIKYTVKKDDRSKEATFRVQGNIDGLKDFKHDIGKRLQRSNDPSEQAFLNRMSDELQSRISFLKRTFRILTKK